MAIIVVQMDIFSYNQICEIHKMAEIEEKEVSHLVAEGVIIRSQHLILFFNFTYMVSCIKKIYNFANDGLSGRSSNSTEQIVITLLSCTRTFTSHYVK